MKKIISVFLAVLLFLAVFLCGCQRKGATVYIAADGDAALLLDKAAEDYNKISKNKIKTVPADKRSDSDAFLFSATDFDSVNASCENLEDMTDGLIHKKLAFTEEGYVYGLPLYTDYAVIVYNKSVLDGTSADEISDFAALKSAATAAKDRYKNIVALPSSEKATVANALLGTALFFELETGDDYNFAPNAAAHAKRLALRFGENLKEFADLFKGEYLSVQNSSEALKAVKDGRAAFTLVSSHDTDFENLDKSLAFCPIFMGIDGEKNRAVTTFTQRYFAINKEAAEDKKSAAEAFFEWLVENGEKYMSSKSTIIPYKTAENSGNGIKAQVQSSIKNAKDGAVISVSEAFPPGFAEIAADSVLDYLSGRATWEYTERVILSAWEVQMADGR